MLELRLAPQMDRGAESLGNWAGVYVCVSLCFFVSMPGLILWEIGQCVCVLVLACAYVPRSYYIDWREEAPLSIIKMADAMLATSDQEVRSRPPTSLKMTVTKPFGIALS